MYINNSNNKLRRFFLVIAVVDFWKNKKSKFRKQFWSLLYQKFCSQLLLCNNIFKMICLHFFHTCHRNFQNRLAWNWYVGKAFKGTLSSFFPPTMYMVPSRATLERLNFFYVCEDTVFEFKTNSQVYASPGFWPGEFGVLFSILKPLSLSL